MADGLTQQDQRALRAVAVQFSINGAVVASYIPRLPEIRDALAVDLATIGQILTIASLGGLLGSWLSGRIMARFGTRTTMIYGTLVVILLLPSVAFASSVWALLLTLTLIMILDPIVDVAMNIQGSNISARRHTPVMNRLHGLWSIGTVIGGLLAAAMASLLIPLHWHLIGASCLMAIGLWYIGGGLLRSDQVEPANKQKAAKKQSLRSRKPLGLWLFAILGATMFVPEMIGSDWSPFRAKDDLQTSSAMASLAYVAFTSGMVFGRLTGDWMSAWLGNQSLLRYAISLSLVGFVLACLVESLVVTYVGLAVAGIGVSVLFPTLYDVAAQDPHRPGAALGALTAGSRGAMLVAPITLGLLADASALTVGAAMALLALPCLLLTAVLAGRAQPE